MIIETDMTQGEVWYQEKLAQRCFTALKIHDIPGRYIPDQSQALTQILEMIPVGVTIGAGDSVTLAQIGVLEEMGI